MNSSVNSTSCSSWCFVCAMRSGNIPCGIIVYSILMFFYLVFSFSDFQIMATYFNELKEMSIKQNRMLAFFTVIFLSTCPFVLIKKYGHIKIPKNIITINLYSIITLIQILCAYASYLLVMTVFFFFFSKVDIFALKLLFFSFFDLYLLAVLKREIEYTITADEITAAMLPARLEV